MKIALENYNIFYVVGFATSGYSRRLFKRRNVGDVEIRGEVKIYATYFSGHITQWQRHFDVEANNPDFDAITGVSSLANAKESPNKLA